MIGRRNGECRQSGRRAFRFGFIVSLCLLTSGCSAYIFRQIYAIDTPVGAGSDVYLLSHYPLESDLSAASGASSATAENFAPFEFNDGVSGNAIDSDREDLAYGMGQDPLGNVRFLRVDLEESDETPRGGYTISFWSDLHYLRLELVDDGDGYCDVNFERPWGDDTRTELRASGPSISWHDKIVDQFDMTTGEWHHFTMIVDELGSVWFFLDRDAFLAIVSYARFEDNWSPVVFIGTASVSDPALISDSRFLLDELFIFRGVLTARDIRDLFTGSFDPAKYPLAPAPSS